MSITYTLEQLEVVAQRILENAEHQVLLFKGDVGAGKTTLIQAIARAAGVQERVSSPTFSLVNEYECEGGMMYHFDFYRIKEEEEALDIGFEEYLAAGKWICIEWFENVQNYLPENAHTMTIESIASEQRKLQMS